MYKIEFYINGTLFRSVDLDPSRRIGSLSDAKSIAHDFMREKFKGYSVSDVSVSFFDGNDGTRKSKIKIKSKDLSRDIILEGLLKENDG